MFRNEGGYAQVFYPDGNTESVVNFDGVTQLPISGNMLEVSTFTCFHCNAVEHVPAKADVNFVGFCRNCMKAICHVCAGKPCMPFEKKLELLESKAETDRHYWHLLERGAA